jgi:hypothetical protein
MENPWFKRKGTLYIPTSTVGWLFLILLLSYWVYSFIAIQRQSHSLKDTLINFGFNALFGFFVYQLIAYISIKWFKNSAAKKV